MADIFRDESVYRRVPRGAEEAGAAAGIDVADKNGVSSAQKEQMKPEFSWKYILYILKKGFVRYFIDAFTGMAQGLFCTLIAGTILGQIGSWITSAGTDAALIVGGGVTAVANIAKMLMGAGPRSSSAGESPPLPTSQRCSWARA